jgi:dinuclear metal center YbgI/SA1388 family protein
LETVKDVAGIIESFAPVAFQESYDNAGLLVGEANTKVSGILIALDVTEEVLDEAISKNCNLIVAHHPVIFQGIKRINGNTLVERVIIKALRNNIAIYAAHTNLDNVHNGVSKRMADKLGLINTKVLLPAGDLLRKLVTFCPPAHSEQVRAALFDAGGGCIGNYSECSFNLSGTGTFKAGEGADPFAGAIGKRHHEEEDRIEVIYPRHLEHALIRKLIDAHPYEEPAYDIYVLANRSPLVGSGIIGELQTALSVTGFLETLKTAFNAGCVRHTAPVKDSVKRIALCGGSGSFLLKEAIKSGADVFVTGDFKYHQFFDAEGKIVIADIGHYESEQFTKDLFYDILTKKNTTFAVRLSETNTNPINYL